MLKEEIREIGCWTNYHDSYHTYLDTHYSQCLVLGKLDFIHWLIFYRPFYEGKTYNPKTKKKFSL